jgi:hypothetical protein
MRYEPLEYISMEHTLTEIASGDAARVTVQSSSRFKPVLLR